MDIKEIYEKLNGDAATTLHRFGNNSKLLERFVKIFPDDASYQEIQSAAKLEDPRELERSAHTLKGTSANLGFQTLSNQCAALVAAVREGKNGQDELAPLIQNIGNEYEKIIALIKMLD